MGFSLGRRMSRMMKRLIIFMRRWMRIWIRDGELEGVWFLVSFFICHFVFFILFFLFFNREARENAELAKHRAERPKIQQQFADLKRGLSSITDEEWETIPEVGNLTRKKRQKVERSFAVPDSVIVGDRSKGEYENALDERQQQVRVYQCDHRVLNLTESNRVEAS
jgi:hypothetical protein